MLRFRVYVPTFDTKLLYSLNVVKKVHDLFFLLVVIQWLQWIARGGGRSSKSKKGLLLFLMVTKIVENVLVWNLWLTAKYWGWWHVFFVFRISVSPWCTEPSCYLSHSLFFFIYVFLSPNYPRVQLFSQVARNNSSTNERYVGYDT